PRHQRGVQHGSKCAERQAIHDATAGHRLQHANGPEELFPRYKFLFAGHLEPSALYVQPGTALRPVYDALSRADDRYEPDVPPAVQSRLSVPGLGQPGQLEYSIASSWSGF